LRASLDKLGMRAKQSSLVQPLDCFVATLLAMTR
jgi:hypothetical protein